MREEASEERREGGREVREAGREGGREAGREWGHHISNVCLVYFHRERHNLLPYLTTLVKTSLHSKDKQQPHSNAPININKPQSKQICDANMNLFNSSTTFKKSIVCGQTKSVTTT